MRRFSSILLVAVAACLPALVAGQSLFSGAPTASPSPEAASPTAGGGGGGGNGDVAPPVDGSCNDVCSETYDSLDRIQEAVDQVAAGASGSICLCPSTFAPESGNCAATEDAAAPSILVSDGQDVTIECVSPLGGECLFACPHPLIQVAAGGKLTLLGHNNTRVTGGVRYSRVHVDPDGYAAIDGVAFESNDAGPEARLLDAEEIKDIGWGGAIYSNGTIEVNECSFTECSASSYGGAIYTGNEASITATSFTGCEAQIGGAVYADGALHITGNIFTDNTAESGANLAGTAALTGCGNAGLYKSTACPDSAAGTGPSPSSGALTAAMLLVAMAGAAL